MRNTGSTEASGPRDNTLKWRFKTGSWVGSSPAVANGRVYVGSYDNYVYAIGKKSQYGLTALVRPSRGGSITLDPPGGTYDEGIKVTATAEPAGGYEFDHWSGDISEAQKSDKEITVIMDSDKSLTAHFRKVTPMNWPLIGGIIGAAIGALAVIGALAMLRRKR